MNECGGCAGLGKHSPRCITQPGWQWLRMQDRAEELGDMIGANDPALANRAYGLAADLAQRAKEEGS